MEKNSMYTCKKKKKIVYSSETTHILQESKKKEDKKYTSQAEIDQKLRELDRAKQKVLSMYTSKKKKES